MLLAAVVKMFIEFVYVPLIVLMEKNSLLWLLSMKRRVSI